MGMWDRALLQAQQVQATKPDWDNFWYEPAGGGISLAGERVNDETALKLSTVFACGRVLWEGVASLPLPVFRRLPNGGKEPARDHPHYRLLHDKPNGSQTSLEFRETLVRWAAFRGNELALVDWAPGMRRGIEAQSIEPLDMDEVDIDLEVNGRQQRVRYYHRPPGGGVREELDPSRVIHFKGMGKNRWVGQSVIAYASNTVGLAQAYERASGRWMKRGMNPSMALTHPKNLSAKAQEHLTESIERVYSGADNAGKVMILEEDMKPLPITLSPSDMQWLESRKLSVTDICRFFRVPPHMVMDLERSTNNNIEHQGLEFVQHTLRPWLVRIEQRLNAALFEGDPEYFCEFNVDGLLRGDATSRSNYYSKAVAFGWMTPNEVRSRENMNPIEGGDKLRPTQGGQGAGQAPGVDQRTGRSALTPGPSPDAAGEGRSGAIVRGVAERCLVREREGLRRLAGRFAGTGTSASTSTGFRDGVRGFYAKHAEYLSEALAVSHEDAWAWCLARADAIEMGGLRVAEGWTVESVLELVSCELRGSRGEE